MTITRSLFSGQLLRCVGLLACGLAGVAGMSSSAVAETRSFAMNWFYPAIYTQPDNCPDGVNPSTHGIMLNALATLGMKREDAEKAIEGAIASTGQNRFHFWTERGTIDGQAVNAYANPLSVPDPGYKLAVGRYAMGFNLDGKTQSAFHQFEEPYIHEQGIDNQLFRIYGCVASYQAEPGKRPVWPIGNWEGARDTMPAWIVSITADDFSNDDDVTIAVDRATTHMLRDAKGEARSNATFRLSNDPRVHNSFKGQIKDGVVTAAAPNVVIQGDPYVLPWFDFQNFRMRLTLKEDGSADGLLGGYLPWLVVYYQHGGNGLNAETVRGLDMVALYHALGRVADSDPDPKTGQNRRISTAWRMEMIPVFALPPLPRANN